MMKLEKHKPMIAAAHSFTSHWLAENAYLRWQQCKSPIMFNFFQTKQQFVLNLQEFSQQTKKITENYKKTVSLIFLEFEKKYNWRFLRVAMNMLIYRIQPAMMRLLP